jgi:hypothetical protein
MLVLLGQHDVSVIEPSLRKEARVFGVMFSRRTLERSTPSCYRFDVDNVPLPASSLASESDSFYDGPFDVSDDEDDPSGSPSTIRIDDDE